MVTTLLGRLSHSKQLLNLALQGISLLTKFALMLAITRLLSLEELGRYQVVSATIAMLAPLGSVQFGKFVQRQLPQSSAQDAARYIKRFILIMMCLSLLVLPAAGWYLSALLSPNSLIIVLCIFLGSVFTTELNFQLIGLHRGTSYNLLNFFSQSAWALPLIAYWLAVDEPSLNTLWVCWCAGQLTALIGFYFASKHLPWKNTDTSWDQDWFKKGLKVSLNQCGILMLSLATVHAMTFLLHHFTDLATVGIYGFFFTVLIAMRQWVLSGSFVLRQPTLIQHFEAKDHAAFKTELRTLLRESVFTYLLSCALALLAIYPVLWLTDNATLGDQLSLFYGFLFAGFGYIFSDILQAIAFIQHRHRLMLYNNILFLIVQLSLALPAILYLPIAYLAMPLGISALMRCVIYYRAMRHSF